MQEVSLTDPSARRLNTHWTAFCNTTRGDFTTVENVFYFLPRGHNIQVGIWCSRYKVIYSKCALIWLANTLPCRVTFHFKGWARFRFFCWITVRFFRALCVCIPAVLQNGLIEMNEAAAFSHAWLLSVWTLPSVFNFCLDWIILDTRTHHFV